MGRPDLQEINLDYCPDELRNEKLEKIGEGGSSQVYRAKDFETGEIIAMKEIRLKKESIEVSIFLYMVLMENEELQITEPEIKCYMKQLLIGLHYCHENGVLHRDIRGENLVLDDKGNLKIASFGLARTFTNDPNEALTNRVVTLWYRSPELLLGSHNYGPAVHLWSAGCVFAELLQSKPFLDGKYSTGYFSRG